MLVLHRREERWEDRTFQRLPARYLAGDCLVFNDSRVFPSRLFGHRSGVHSLRVGKNNPKRFENLSGRVEVFLLRPVSDDRKTWDALVRPGRKMRTGERVSSMKVSKRKFFSRGEFGERTLRFDIESDIYEELERIGHVPLPPYIRAGFAAGSRALPDGIRARIRVRCRTNGRIALHTRGDRAMP